MILIENLFVIRFNYSLRINIYRSKERRNNPFFWSVIWRYKFKLLLAVTSLNCYLPLQVRTV